MQTYFFELADAACAMVRGAEILLVQFSGERSDFIRFNRSAVRQAGSVSQGAVTIDLVDGNRHAAATVTIASDPATDRARLESAIAGLREQLPYVPEDPYLLYATTVSDSEQHGEDRLPDSSEPLAAILAAGAGKDLVGIHAQGGIYCGFANSLGQRNWFSSHSFHLNWSFYHAGDKAVKTSYAGFAWSPEEFERKVAAASHQLEILRRPPTTVSPGRYRVYLAPTALEDVIEILSWDGFSVKAHRTKTTPLLKLVGGEESFSPAVTIRENTAGGIAPDFQGQGFRRPPRVELIERGRLAGSLVSPRSGKEYGLEPNGATGAERPESLDMEGGDVPLEAVLARLERGIYVNQTWYLNYSDRNGCRMTGMTRFATFWVEAGEIVAPLNVMRFDETAYRAFGANLIGLTAERDFLPAASTYGSRATTSMRLPGALIDDFTFTL